MIFLKDFCDFCDFLKITRYASSISTKCLSKETLDNPADQVYFSCEKHSSKNVKRIAISIIAVNNTITINRR